MSQRTIQHLVVLGLLTTHGASRAAVIDEVEIAPLWRTQNTTLTDNFYTISKADRDLSISCCGYVSRASTAFMAVAGGTGRAAFMRFWKGAPQLEHFYSHLLSERTAIEPLGWLYEGNEGFVFNNNANGLSALHRFARSNPATLDLQHYFTLNSTETATLVAAGWSYDGIKGYVLPLNTPTAYVSFYLYGVAGSLYAVLPFTYDYQASNPTSSANIGCHGKVSVTLDGTFRGAFNSAQWGYLPGSVGEPTCFISTGISVPPGSHNLYIEHSGFAARIAGTSAGSGSYDYWALVPPSARGTSFIRSQSQSNGRSESAVSITHDEPIPLSSSQAPEGQEE